MSRGFFISFEGGEGSGKSTQIRRLARWLKKNSHKVVVTREPGEGAVGRGVRNLLLNPKFHPLSPRAEVFLYQADRAQHAEHFLRPKLNAGFVVITDRYGDSSAAYQGYARKMGIEWIEKLNHFSTVGLVPDLTFILDVPPKVYKERLKKRKRLDRIESEKGNFHLRVREGFLKLARRGGRYKIVDASRSIDEVAFEIQEILKRKMRI